MGIRSVKLELEAKFVPTGGGLFSRPSGKVERKSYADMGERLKISVRNLKVPDGTEAVVISNGVELARLTIESGSSRYDNESKDPSAFPPLNAGDIIEVAIDNEPVLSGKLYVD